jgi:photosystem II stability/assembly factor-like uncharacterized protein
MMRRTLWYGLVCALLSQPLLAGNNVWTPAGPEVSSVRALAVSPAGVAYAGTSEFGVFRSVSGGARWSPLPPPLPSDPVREIAVDPGDAQSLYILTTHGLYWSRNGNALRRLGATRLSSFLEDLGVSPADPDRIYVFNGGSLDVSRDRGVNWSNIYLPFNSTQPVVLAVDPRDADVLFFGVADGGVYKSEDGGATWHATQRPANLDPNRFATVVSLIFDPANPDVMFAGTRSQGIWKSTDAGETWRIVYAVRPGIDTVKALAVDPRQPRRVYAGIDRYVAEHRPAAGEIWRSDDFGESWTRGHAAAFPILSLAVDPTNGAAYAGMERLGVLKSTDGGATWKLVRGGLRAFSAFDITADPLDRGSLWIAAPEISQLFESEFGFPFFFYTGVYHSENGGGIWKLVQGLGSDRHRLERIFADGGEPGRLWASSTVQTYRSDDGGATWRLARELNSVLVSDIASDPAHPDRLFLAGSQRKLVNGDVIEAPVLWRSLNGGESWTELDTSSPPANVSGRMNDVEIHPERPATVDAVGIQGFFRSLDGGDTWTSLGTNAPKPCPQMENALVIDPFQPKALYSLDCDFAITKIHRSNDAGAHWLASPLTLPNVVDAALTNLVADPNRPGRLYAAGSAGVFVTENRGATWRAFNTGLPPGVTVLSLTADPFVKGRFYAGLQGAGLFVMDRR